MLEVLCSPACGMINSPVLGALQTEQRQILVPLRRQRQAQKFWPVWGQLHEGNLNTMREHSFWGSAVQQVKRTLSDGRTSHTGKRGRVAQEENPSILREAERTHPVQPVDLS